MPSTNISRRKFLVLGGLLTVTAALRIGQDNAIAPAPGTQVGSVPAVSPLGWPVVPSPANAPVVITRGQDYVLAARQAISSLGGNGLLAHPGERVVIKPALAFDRSPGWGVNTHPDVLRALISGALSAGASEVILFDRTACDSTWAYRTSGAERMVRELGDHRVRLLALTGADFVNLAESQNPGGLNGDYLVCRHVLEADRVINVGTLGQHPARGVSAAMANLVGLIGGSKADAEWRHHQDAQLVALSAAIRPALSVLDATSSVIRNGPLGNSLADVAQWHTIIASTDPVAVDSAGLLLFAQSSQTGSAPGNAAAPAYLDLARQFGLGAPIPTFADPRVIDLRKGGAA